jgi:bacterioferritin-associated ferredoxin
MYGLQTHDGTRYRLTTLPPYRPPVTSRAGAVRVSACICRATPFAELLPRARANGWDLAALMRDTGCGAQCGLCRPYLKRMLLTGETVFSELLSPESLP